jgi:four helix bundle protein
VKPESSVVSKIENLLSLEKTLSMFLELAHTKLDVFQVSRAIVLTCYSETNSFPPDERYAMVQQIRRAALSVHLNIAEGCSRKSLTERKRYYEIARGSLIEIDTALDIAVALHYSTREKLSDLGELLTRSFPMISKLIR